MKSRVFIPLTGGLGNQLFQIATGMSATQGKVLVISCLGSPRETNDLPDSQQMVFPPRVEFKVCRKRHGVSKNSFNLLLSSISRRQYIQRYSVLRIPLSILCGVIFSIHLGAFIYPKIGKGIGYDSNFFRLNGNFFVGYFQTYRYMLEAKTSGDIRDIYCNSTNEKYLELRESAIRKKPLMLHVRLGDYLKEEKFGPLSSPFFKSAIDLAGMKNIENEIWLFSDEPAKALSLLPVKILEKIFVVPNIGITPTETLEIMRNCQSFIISNSTFSWWAAYLSKFSNQKVLYPTPWFTGISDPVDLIPNSWVPVERS